MFVRVESVVPDGKGDVYDVTMSAPHHSFVANGLVVHNCADLGGVKLDLLANKGLDVLTLARDLVYGRHHVWIDYDGFGFGVPEGCPVEKVVVFGDDHCNDPAIWGQIDIGQTAGIFQLHTPSGTKTAMRFRPRSLADVADLVSINRPGVIRAGLLDAYLRRRAGEEEVVYDHPLMEVITGATQGVLVYQEQLIRTARELAGFSPGDAEKLRKAIGKKQTDVMASLEPQFIAGCLDNSAFLNHYAPVGGSGVPHRVTAEKTARKIWASLEASGSYSFNKSHAYGYGLQACWEVWTKHYFYDEFITACLAVHTDKTARFVAECRQRGRPILPPDVNDSADHFSLTKDGIRWGLSDIRQLGPGAVPDIVSRRPYFSLADYLNRVQSDKGGKRQVVENLIKVGAFDDINPSRSDLLREYHYHRAASEVAPKKWGGLTPEQRDAIVAEKWAKKPQDYEIPDFTDERVVASIEKELLGLLVSVDPMERYAKMINSTCIRHPAQIEDYQPDQEFAIGGELTACKVHTQKNGRKMAFLTVTWAGEDFEVPAFADAWSSCGPLLTVGAPVVLHVARLKGGGAHLKNVLLLDAL